MNDWTDVGSYAYNKLQSENEDLKRLVESQCYDLDAMSAIKEERDECYVLLKQALDAMTNVLAGGDFDNPYADLKAAAAAIKERLA
jgi:hypothetical protein